MSQRSEFARFELTDIMIRTIDRAMRDKAIRLRKIEMASRNVAADSENAGWFCLSVMTGHEFAVEKALEDACVHVLVPRRKGRVAKRRGRLISAPELPVMPGYVLVRIAPLIDAFAGLREIDHVIGIIGSGETPLRIPEKNVIEFKLMAERGAYDFRDVRLTFAEGDHVRISHGPFASFHGLVRSTKGARHGRVEIELSVFGRMSIVEMDIAQIEKL